MNKIYDDYCNQKFNLDYICLITASNSTFRAFHKKETYVKNSPSKIFRSWIRKFLVDINKIDTRNFDEIYQIALEDFSNYWNMNSGVTLSLEKEYLLYKLVDLFFKHAFLYNKMKPEISELIKKNAMPPLDSLVLLALVGKNEILKTNDEIILQDIPAKPSMGNIPKKGKDIKNYSDFRKRCHSFFHEWSVKNNTYPLCYDVLAWNASSNALQFID